MVLMTMIARIADGLPLAASMQEEEQAGRSLHEYQTQAKQLFRRMDSSTPVRGSLETGQYLFQRGKGFEVIAPPPLEIEEPNYFVERGVCYLVLCESNFSKRQAFSYLEDLQTEFAAQYGAKIETVSRPYSFIEFDTFIQKTKKTYMDSRSRRNFSQLNTELQDVQRIMTQNIEDVLLRGEALSALDDKASNLKTLSDKYKKDAHYLNLKSSYAKIAGIVVVIIVFLLFIRYWLF